jgi:hypothetical protein
MTRRTGLGALLLMILALFLSPAARSQEVPVEQLKAAFLYNFVRFVDWPTNSLGPDTQPMIIGVIGNDKFANELSTLLKEKKAHNHPIVVKKLATPADAATCQVVFVADGDARRAMQVAEATKDNPILLVGESEDFLNNGGMISIVPDDKQKKLGFDVNQPAAEKRGLVISSNLLKVARKKPGATGGTQ